MQTIQIDHPGQALDFHGASLIALETARQNKMQQPTIMAWHQNSDAGTPPVYDGADPDTWWAKYGAGNGGKLEVCVGDDFQFVMMDTLDYETLGMMPLRNLSDDQGNEYLCFTPMLDKDSRRPTPSACTQLDDWLADQL